MGSKLEAKDGTGTICVATIKAAEPTRVLVSFDGWTAAHDIWCEDPQHSDWLFPVREK